MDDIEVLAPANTNTIAATATSQSRELPTGGSGNHNAVFYNDGPGLVLVVTGMSTVIATLPAIAAAAGAEGNATPVPVGTSLSFRRGHVNGQHNTHWAAICLAGGTANVYCTPGTGL